MKSNPIFIRNEFKNKVFNYTKPNTFVLIANKTLLRRIALDEYNGK